MAFNQILHIFIFDTQHTTQMKRCHKCKIEQPLDNFVNNKNSKDGKHSACKSCVKIYQQSVKDKLRAYQQKYQSVYRTEHKEELLTYLKEYQKGIGREKHYRYIKEWQKRNPEKVEQYKTVSKERAKLKKAND